MNLEFKTDKNAELEKWLKKADELAHEHEKSAVHPNWLLRKIQELKLGWDESMLRSKEATRACIDSAQKGMCHRFVLLWPSCPSFHVKKTCILFQLIYGMENHTLETLDSVLHTMSVCSTHMDNLHRIVIRLLRHTLHHWDLSSVLSSNKTSIGILANQVRYAHSPKKDIHHNLLQHIMMFVGTKPRWTIDPLQVRDVTELFSSGYSPSATDFLLAWRQNDKNLVHLFTRFIPWTISSIRQTVGLLDGNRVHCRLALLVHWAHAMHNQRQFILAIPMSVLSSFFDPQKSSRLLLKRLALWACLVDPPHRPYLKGDAVACEIFAFAHQERTNVMQDILLDMPVVLIKLIVGFT